MARTKFTKEKVPGSGSGQFEKVWESRPSSRSGGQRSGKVEEKKKPVPKEHCHRMVTRNKGKAIFKFFELPAEVRNNILGLVLKEDGEHDLEELRIPPLMHTSQRMREEAGPVFFSVNTFVARSIGASDGMMRGDVSLSTLLPGNKFVHHPTIAPEVVKMQEVKIKLSHPVNGRFQTYNLPLGTVTLCFDQKEPVIELDISSPEAGDAILLMGWNRSAEDVVREIAQRVPLNGFAIEDVKKVTKCFVGKLRG